MSMEQLYTPGEWVFCAGENGPCGCGMIYGGVNETDGRAIVATVAGFPDFEALEQQANMRLIAAAPNMYEALAQLAEIISDIEAQADEAGIDMQEAREWWQRADAALAKVKGQSNE